MWQRNDPKSFVVSKNRIGYLPVSEQSCTRCDRLGLKQERIYHAAPKRQQLYIIELAAVPFGIFEGKSLVYSHFGLCSVILQKDQGEAQILVTHGWFVSLHLGIRTNPTRLVA
mmetsp:Transcript_22058/g.50902  ORF Transcript_22058/g.50902 Transcript_22058/m.50902 type:complete len:113 (-) Transcript_22058:187-525(-)